MTSEGQTGDPLAGLPDLPSGLDPEGEHDYLRCKACSYLDRSDFWMVRLKASNLRIGCSKCGAQTFTQPLRLSLKEMARIRSGFYETYREFADE